MKKIINTILDNRFKKSAGYAQRIFLCTLISFVSLSGYSQILGKLQEEVYNNKPKPLLRLDTRNSFVANAPVRIRGIQFGAKFGDKLQLGLGFHSNRWSKELPKSEYTGNTVLLDYISLFMEYQFYEKGKFFASYPMQIGFGDIFTVDNEKNALNHKFLMSYEALLVVNYKPIDFASVGLGLGYRFLLAGNGSQGLNYNSPIYSVKFNLYFEEIIALIKDGRY